MSANLVILVGNLGADPEVNTTNSGMKVANLRLATSGREKRGDQWEEVTEWHRVVAFGRTAEVLEQYATKGKQLFVRGRLRTRKWQDKDGNDRYSTEVVCDEMKLLGGGSGEKQERSSGGYQGGGGYGGGGY